MRGLHGATLVFLLIVGLGPLLWMLKSSITPTLDTLRQPMALWPNGFDLSQFATAWNRVHIDRYLLEHAGHRVRVVADPDRRWPRPPASPCRSCGRAARRC